MGSSTENISFIPARRGGFHLKDKTGFLYYKSKPQKAKDNVGATGAAFPIRIPAVLPQLLHSFPLKPSSGSVEITITGSRYWRI
jgi:hypothetical protein